MIQSPQQVVLPSAAAGQSGNSAGAVAPRLLLTQPTQQAQQLATGQTAPEGPAAAALSWVIEALGKVTDPTLIQALGPQSGLQVTPVNFQSIEQEGRWKPVAMVDKTSSPGRNFVLTKQLDNATSENSKAIGVRQPYGDVIQNIATVFTLTTALGSKVSCDAIWWSDGLEIFAGYCGMAQATGFGSVYNDMALFAFQAIPFGNYWPAAVLLTWSGWVNPVGPDYYEFKGAITLSAVGSTALNGGKLGKGGIAQSRPSYVQAWSRGKQPIDVPWNNNAGFDLNLATLPQMQSASPQSR
jgi:hypothetical protein